MLTLVLSYDDTLTGLFSTRFHEQTEHTGERTASVLLTHTQL